MNPSSKNKVSPHTIPSVNLVKTPRKIHRKCKNILCLCRIISCLTIPNRLLGRFPFSWKCTNGKCVYKLSISWMIYSVMLTLIFAVLSKNVIVYLEFRASNLPLLLDSLIALSSVIFVYLGIFHLFNLRVWIQVAEDLNRINNKNHLFCEKSKGSVILFEKCILGFTFVMFLTQNLCYLFIKLFVAQGLQWSPLLIRNLKILPDATYLLWFTGTRYLISMFICFENVVMNYLNYQNIHPGKSITFTHNEYKFFGLLSSRTVCDEKHYIPGHLQHLSIVKMIEYLRITHEEMYQIILVMQKFASPQLLIYLLMEIVTLIVSSYSIVVYCFYHFDSPSANASIILNSINFVWHGAGTFWFIRNLHDLKKVIQGLKLILTACALNAKTAEEHQQLRIFINKVANQQPITVNDLFEIDLGIIGPIVGNILTYVLVVLQFDIPPQDQN